MAGPTVPFDVTQKWLYLIHFTEPHFHARHYLGSSEEVLERIERHANGQGARITRALWLGGEEWTLAALFRPRNPAASIRDLERRAKKRKSAKDYCPLCTRNFISPPGCVRYPTPAIGSLDLRRSTE